MNQNILQNNSTETGDIAGSDISNFKPIQIDGADTSNSQNTLAENKVDGDMAGRDINKQTINLNVKGKSQLRLKIEQIQRECLHDPEFKSCISRLTHYLNPIDIKNQRDLKTKLLAAGRNDEVNDAEELKEKFAKLLVKNSLSEQAQDAYAHVLGKIKLNYDAKVKSLLKENASLVLVEAAVLEVVNEIYDDLCGTVLEHDYREIKGMLYFLTGNCHIEWKY